MGHFFPRRKKKHSNWIIFLSIHHLPHLTRSTSPLPPHHQSWLFPLIFWEVMAAQFTGHTIGQQKGRQGVVNEGRVCVCVCVPLTLLCPPSYTTVSGPAPACPTWIWRDRTLRWHIRSGRHTPGKTHTEKLLRNREDENQPIGEERWVSVSDRVSHV